MAGAGNGGGGDPATATPSAVPRLGHTDRYVAIGKPTQNTEIHAK